MAEAGDATSRMPLHERSRSQSNRAQIRLVPSTPPQLLPHVSQSPRLQPHPPPSQPLQNHAHSENQSSKDHHPQQSFYRPPTHRSESYSDHRDDIYSRTPLPTHPSHILGPKSKDVTSPRLFQSFAKAQPSQDPTGSSTHNTLQPTQNVNAATPPPPTKIKAPTKKRLHIHADNKTFSLLQDDSAPVEASTTSPIVSPSSSLVSLPSYASNTEARTSSFSASYALDEDSTLTTIPGTPPSEAQHKPSSPLQTSPWNYQLVGGLRKVPQTPDLKQKAAAPSEDSLPEHSSSLPNVSHGLATKSSFQSAATASTASEYSNYKLYSPAAPPEPANSRTAPQGDDSKEPAESRLGTDQASHPASDSTSDEWHSVPADSASVIYRPQTSPSESESYIQSLELSPSSSLTHNPATEGDNYQLYGPRSDTYSVNNRPSTSNSETGSVNYIVHGTSPSASYTSLAPPSKYSHESLIVAPLKPRAHRSNEHLGYYKSRSRESLRTGSFTSISTVLSKREALRAIVGSGSIVHLSIPTNTNRSSSTWAPEPLGSNPTRSYMNEHPHQWSSQLSTVASVSDIGTDRNSRSWSDGRRSSGFPSTPSRNSRHVLSVSSAGGQEDWRAQGDLIEAPQPVYARQRTRHLSSSSIRVIEDHDEYGDGLADLQDLRSRPSRTRLSSGFYSINSDNGRTNTMKSTSSSRANSLLAASIPTWARLYYGSGERRYLGGAPGSSTEASESRSSSFRSGSPNTDNLPLGIYSPRKRPREVMPGGNRHGSMSITPAPRHDDDGHLVEDRNPRGFRTWSMSSIWSPHLRHDKRATRHSMWEPPSMNWSTESGFSGKRNVQIVMFIAGFILPFSWMIASLLPLPPNPMSEMQERDNSTSNLDSSHDNFNTFQTRYRPVDEARYESAKWWRRLNRWMSVIGFLLIAAIIVLAVLGVRQKW